MKILYIAELEPNGKFGGAIVENRNLISLKSKYDVEEVKVYATGRGFFCKLKDLLFSKVPTLYTRKQVSKIKKLIRHSDANIVFIETSKMGYFAKYAKKFGKKVICFLHNCEIKLFGDTRGKMYVPFVKKQERLSLEYSDYLIYLNERDKIDFNKIYTVSKSKKNSIIPITFADKVMPEVVEEMKSKEKGNKGLFFGSFFSPNYNGIKWFVENVSEEINGSLDIVGLNFDGHKELSRSNVNVVGTVNDLSHYIINSDFVVFPIFEGSGMKVKTCEALMYGKKIFATDEALEGYLESDSAYSRCNTKEEFIKNINEYLASNEPPYIEAARKLYENNYSNDYFDSVLSTIIQEI